jgi:hypothetical protein
VPARRAPLLYLGFAHACLLLGLGLLAARPELGGFYYHPRLIAVVHLVTLGFLTSAILGSLYIVCPLALRLPLPEGPADAVAAVSWMIGVSGIASHFWLEGYSGVAWAGGLALLTPLWVGGRVLAGLRRAPVPLESRLPCGLAIGNLYAAGVLGVLLGIDKHAPFLPASHLAAVHAHLHLGAVGFATLMVVGVGYRILPMVLPAAMPTGRIALASGLAIEAGVLGLAGAIAWIPALVPAFALLIVAGVGLFLTRVVQMVRNRRPPPADRPRPDWPLGHVFQAVGYLAVSCALGLVLAFSEPSEATLRLVFAYGVCGLLGFLGHLVVGIESRIVPLAAWIRAYADTAYAVLPPSIHADRTHAVGWLPLALWTLGVPGLAAGLSFEATAATSLSAGGLAIAAAVVLASGTLAVRALRPRRPTTSPK